VIVADQKKRPVFDPWLIPPDPPVAPPPPVAQGPLSVSQITAAIKQAISNSLPATVHVLGQISNLKRNTSGHLYFTLKDAHSELPCVMWRTDAVRLKFQPADGMEVVAGGGIEVFDRAGRYQLYVRRLEPRGVGALELAFRQLYERLAKEGLFDAQRKKKIPVYPRRIAVITSPTGAAISDILRTIAKRFPCVHILIVPVRVQGSGAALEIASAIRLVNAEAERLRGVDVLIIGRGGGSLEDLWAFNEEPVARAIFASRIPIISGVGHEVDTTIADLIADARAATPTAAAQMAVPVLDDLLQGLAAIRARLSRSVRVRWDAADSRSKAISKRSPLRDPMAMIRARAQTVDLLGHELHKGHARRAGMLRARLDRLERIIQRIAPYSVVAALSARLTRLDLALRESFWKRTALRARAAEAVARRLERSSPARVLPAAGQKLLQSHRRLVDSHARRLANASARLKSVAGLLQAISHKSVLERGYSITRLKESGKLIRSISDVQSGGEIVTQVQDGQFESHIDSA
jgi:exodeoxyribonuclease VII large subunit